MLNNSAAGQTDARASLPPKYHNEIVRWISRWLGHPWQNTHSLLTDNHGDQISRDCPLVERLTETVVIDGDEMGESREQPAMVELLFIAIVLYSGDYVAREEGKSPPDLSCKHTQLH